MEREIRGVDGEFVRTRIELFEGARDPRVLGLVMDPRVGADLAFNTWREFGADTLWELGMDDFAQNGVENGIEDGEAAENGTAEDGISENGEAMNGESHAGENGKAVDGENAAHENGKAMVNRNGRTTGVKPDKLRRSQDDWNMGGTLILPAREGSTDYEVLLTIPGPAMDLLCRDWGFMRWVSGVVG